VRATQIKRRTGRKALSGQGGWSLVVGRGGLGGESKIWTVGMVLMAGIRLPVTAIPGRFVVSLRVDRERGRRREATLLTSFE
jgi:hypothetical protein